MSTQLKTLFEASELRNKVGDVVDLQSVAGKTIGIYFSAHWCPPCRRFTPILTAKYTEILAAGNEFEIIFVSLDEDEESYNEYYKEMPWLTLSFADSERKDFLANHFRVRGIPFLVILDNDGSVITKDGTEVIVSAPFNELKQYEQKRIEAEEAEERERMIVETESRILLDEAMAALPLNVQIAQHPDHILLKNTAIEDDFKCALCGGEGSGVACSCAECSYHVHPHCALNTTSNSGAGATSINLLAAVLSGASLKDKAGAEVSVDSLRGKTVGLYVSAHWCGPCRQFTPELAAKYAEFQAAGHPFEVVFLSWDKSEAEADAYFAEMPWTRLDYSEKARNQFISQFFKVDGIPSLLLFDGSGAFLTSSGREAVTFMPFDQLHNFETVKAEKAKALIARMEALPVRIHHEAHEHDLVKTDSPYPHGMFGCDLCSRGGERWTYHCAQCQFDSHPECVLGNCTIVTDTAVSEGVKEEADGPAQASVTCDENGVCSISN